MGWPEALVTSVAVICFTVLVAAGTLLWIWLHDED